MKPFLQLNTTLCFLTVFYHDIDDFWCSNSFATDSASILYIYRANKCLSTDKIDGGASFANLKIDTGNPSGAGTSGVHTNLYRKPNNNGEAKDICVFCVEKLQYVFGREAGFARCLLRRYTVVTLPGLFARTDYINTSKR